MFTLHPSDQIPPSTSKVVRRTFSERLSSRPFQSFRVITKPLVVQIGNHIYAHGSVMPLVRGFLQRHGMA
jgi:hypothetical protein